MKDVKEKKENRPWIILELVLFAVSLVLFCMVFAQNPQTTDASSLNPYLYWIYVLVCLAICVTLLFPLVNAFKDSKKLLRLVILIVAAVVIVGGAWLLAPGSPIETNAVTTPKDFKLADAVLYITYLALAAAIIALIWSAVRSSVKK